MDATVVIGVVLCLTAVAILLKSKKSKAKRNRGPVTTSGWRIGPFFNGENYSRNMPLSPEMFGGGWILNFPPAPGHVNYVQNFNPGVLRPGAIMRVAFKMEGRAVPVENPDLPASMSLLIQRNNDNGRSPGYRWHAKRTILFEGEHVIEVPLTRDAWGDMLQELDEKAFLDTLNDVSNVGIVFGSSEGVGHGVYGEGRFVLHSMTIR